MSQGSEKSGGKPQRGEGGCKKCQRPDFISESVPRGLGPVLEQTSLKRDLRPESDRDQRATTLKPRGVERRTLRKIQVTTLRRGQAALRVWQFS